MTAILTTLVVLSSMMPPPMAEPRPDIDQPEPQPHVLVIARPAEAPSPLTGRASWYEYVQGGAAAGPDLRKALGSDWRGQKVTVCANGECVRVTLSDWCQCYKGEKRERIIDLDVRSFAALAPTSAGLTKVTIRE